MYLLVVSKSWLLIFLTKRLKTGKNGFVLACFRPLPLSAFSLENPIQVVIATEIEALVESLFIEEDSSEQVMIMFHAQTVNKIFQE